MIRKALYRPIIRLVTLLLVSFILLILLIAMVISKPPVEEFNTFRSIVNANGLNVNPYEKVHLANAKFFREAAYNEWHEQNRKCILIRDYTESKRMILMAISIVEEANKDDEKALGDTIGNPVQDKLAYSSISDFEQRASLCLPKWNKWVSDALTYSLDKKSVVLIIDKHNQNCLVIENGNVTFDFLIEMGVNYLNDKQLKGDNATVEGSYYIISKKDSTKTDHYKSLQLNFPNREDRARYKKAFQNGNIPNLEVLTDRVSIHGNGGKGYNWTNGNIAIDNEGMEKLFDMVKIGTKVVIVGSTKDILRVQYN